MEYYNLNPTRYTKDGVRRFGRTFIRGGKQELYSTSTGNKRRNIGIIGGGLDTVWFQKTTG